MYYSEECCGGNTQYRINGYFNHYTTNICPENAVHFFVYAA